MLWHWLTALISSLWISFSQNTPPLNSSHPPIFPVSSLCWLEMTSHLCATICWAINSDFLHLRQPIYSSFLNPSPSLPQQYFSWHPNPSTSFVTAPSGPPPVFFTNRNKQLFFKMRLDSPKPQKRYMHTLTVCSSRELLSQANSYWEKKNNNNKKKRATTKQNKTKILLYLEKFFFCHHSFCKAILYYFRC